MTPKDAAQLLAIAELGGCRPPEGLRQNFEIAAQTYAGVFTAAGLDYDAAASALAGYLAEPNLSGYPKAWPDPGAILARTPGARTRTALLNRAREVCGLALAARGSIGGVLDEIGYDPLFLRLERTLGPLGEAVKEAIETAIESTGGWRVMGMVETHDRDYRERWVAAFTRTLTEQPLHHALPAATPPQIP